VEVNKSICEFGKLAFIFIIAGIAQIPSPIEPILKINMFFGDLFFLKNKLMKMSIIVFFEMNKKKRSESLIRLNESILISLLIRMTNLLLNFIVFE
jgi:hypothetical protein